jgi:hypothetical protein
MILIGYSRAAPAARSAAASITALPAQGATTLVSAFGTAAHEFTQDVSSVPNGARCLLAAWGWDNTTNRELGNILPDGGAAVPNLAKASSQSTSDGSKKRMVGIYEWTKASQTSVVFTVGFTGTGIDGAGFQLFYMQDVHASTVTATRSGTAVGAGSVALSSALPTAANGVALFACAQGEGAALTGSWSTTPVHETDQPVEQYLQIHAASYQTTGASLSPTLTFSGTADDACMVAVAIPPA